MPVEYVPTAGPRAPARPTGPARRRPRRARPPRPVGQQREHRRAVRYGQNRGWSTNPATPARDRRPACRATCAGFRRRRRASAEQHPQQRGLARPRCGPAARAPHPAHAHGRRAPPARESRRTAAPAPQHAARDLGSAAMPRPSCCRVTSGRTNANSPYAGRVCARPAAVPPAGQGTDPALFAPADLASARGTTTPSRIRTRRLPMTSRAACGRARRNPRRHRSR